MTETLDDLPSVRHRGRQLVAWHRARRLRINPREPTVAAAFGVGLAALQALQQRLA